MTLAFYTILGHTDVGDRKAPTCPTAVTVDPQQRYLMVQHSYRGVFKKKLSLNHRLCGTEEIRNMYI